jgi:hypothetical protein
MVIKPPLFVGPATEVGVPRPPELVTGNVRICPEFVVAYKNWQALQREFCIVGEPPHPARETRISGIREKAKVARWVGMHIWPSLITCVGYQQQF